MRYAGLLLAIGAMALSLCAPSLADPNYIYAMHDPGGEVDMSAMGTKGWIVFTTEIGHNPNDYSGTNYTSYTNAGYGVIVRLNNGYDSNGTIPYQSEYQNFAQRCANYVNASPGCHIWIIGNETNLPREWPGNVGGDPNTGEAITVARYVDCYNRCYNAIKALAGHGSDQIIPAAVGTYGPPYNASYPPNRGIEGFADYFVNMLNAIGSTKVNAIAIHAYTHGADPALVFSEALMGPPYQDIHYHFRVYKDYMNRIPTGMRTLPVYLTETDQCNAWVDTNSGWVRNVYAEINSWNQSSSQKIRCVALFRWQHAGEGDAYYICDRGGVRQDWRDAMTYQYVWNTGVSQNDANSGVDAGNTHADALAISPGAYTGYVDGTDTNDYYKFAVTSGQTITVSMTPPAGSDFDLYLYNASGTQKGTSLTRSAGASEIINFTADSTGDWRMRVYRYSGSGAYSFRVTLNAMNRNTPGGTNMATSSSQWQTDSNYGSDWTGAKAIDGVVSASSKWTSTGSVATHWLSLDLGANRTVNGFIVRHAGAGGELTSYNTQLFQIQSASSLSGPWTDECSIDNLTQTNTTSVSYATPKSLRYVRLYITDPGTDNYARIPEFEVWCTSEQMNGNTPTGVNMAPSSAQWQTDSNYGSEWTGAKAIDAIISSTSKWTSTGSVATHWLSLDLGASRTVNGFIVRHAGAGGEPTYYNTEAFKLQSASSMSGPWSDECTVDNSAQANITTRSYVTPKQLRYVRLYITDPGIDNYARIPEFEVWCAGSSTTENFESMPSWNSSFDAAWGSAATWSIVGGGQSGNCLQASRSSQGSSSKAKVYTVSANTNITVSIWIKCPNYAGGSYWAECACKLGSQTAQDFDGNPGTWTMIKKFSDSGTNGNGNTWTQYTTSLNTGSYTQLTLGFKHGASACTGPTVCWDTMVIQ